MPDTKRLVSGRDAKPNASDHFTRGAEETDNKNEDSGFGHDHCSPDFLLPLAGRRFFVPGSKSTNRTKGTP